MVHEKKQKLVQDLVEDIKKSPIVGLVNFENLPARQLQIMRAMLLSNGVTMRMARKKLLGLALTESKKEGIEELKERMKGLPALLFSSENPFTLYAKIQKNKSPAPAKAGQEAPKDIVVKAGATNFAPGPIISELGAVGIKTKVEGGKLAIIDDVTVAKEGDVISGELASMLTRLDIQPMEVGLDLVAIWEDGTVFEAKQLRIDEAEYAQNFTQAAQWAMNLAIEAAIPTADTIEVLLQKSFRDAKALALEQDILTDLTAGDILAKVERQALALKDVTGVETVAKEAAAPAEEAKEEEKSEPAPEAPAEEEKKEEAAPETAPEETKEEPQAEPEQAQEETSSVNEGEGESTTEETPTNDAEESTEDPKESESQETSDTESTEESTESEETQEEEKTEVPEQETPAEEEVPAEDPKEEPPVEEQKEEEPEQAPEESQPEETPAKEPAPIEEEKKEEQEEESEPETEKVQEEAPQAEETPEPQNPIQSDDAKAQAIIQAMKDKFAEETPSEQPQTPTQTETVSAENLVEELKQEAHEEQEQKQEEAEEQKSVEEAEDLFNKLMKKGTLRDEQS